MVQSKSSAIAGVSPVASGVPRTTRAADSTVRSRDVQKAVATWAHTYCSSAENAVANTLHPDRGFFPVSARSSSQPPSLQQPVAYYQLFFKSLSFFDPGEARQTGRGNESAGTGLPQGTALVMQVLTLRGKGDTLSADATGTPRRVLMEELSVRQPFFFTAPLDATAAFSVTLSIPSETSPTGAVSGGWGFVVLRAPHQENPHPTRGQYVSTSPTLTLYAGSPQALQHLPLRVIADHATALSPKKTVDITIAQYFLNEAGAQRQHGRVCDRMFPLAIESVAYPPSGLVCLNDAKSGDATGPARVAAGLALRKFNPDKSRGLADLSVLDVGVGGLRRFCFQLELRQIQVTFLRDAAGTGLQQIGERLATLWGLVDSSGVPLSQAVRVANLRLQAFPHNGLRLLAPSVATFDLVPSQPEALVVTYTVAGAKGGANASDIMRLSLPAHQNTGVVFQLLADVHVNADVQAPTAGKKQCIILAWSVYLPAVQGLRTLDSRDLIKVNMLKGPFTSLNGDVVTDALQEKKTQQIRGFTESVVKLEFQSEISASPESRLQAEQRQKLLQDKKRDRLREKHELERTRRESKANKSQHHRTWSANSTPRDKHSPAQVTRETSSKERLQDGPVPPSAPVKHLTPTGRITDDGYEHKAYCNGTCGKKCNFDVPRKIEPSYPYPPQDIRVVTVEPDALFLTPHHCVQPSDHKMLEAYHFTKPLASQPPSTYSDKVPMLNSIINIEFQALLSPSLDCPPRIFFQYRFKCSGHTKTPTGVINKKQDTMSELGGRIHLLHSMAAGGHGVKNTMEWLVVDEDAAGPEAVTSTPEEREARQARALREQERYLLDDTLYVEVYDADTLFLWGTCEVDLHPLHRKQNCYSRNFCGETAVIDAIPLELERTPPDDTKPLMSRTPEVKAVLIYQLQNEGVPSHGAVRAPNLESVVNAAKKKRHRVVARRLVGKEEMQEMMQEVKAASPRGRAGSLVPAGVSLSPTHTQQHASATLLQNIVNETAGRKSTVAPCAASTADAQQVYFKCEEADVPLRPGWSLATSAQCNQHLQAVARAMDQTAGSWVVCQIEDGDMKGRGYGCVITKTEEAPRHTYRIVAHVGPLDEVDRKLVGESELAALRRARSDYVKDQLLRDMATKMEGKERHADGSGVRRNQQGDNSTREFYELEERLEAISRVRVKGKRKEAMLKAQLQDALTHEVTVHVTTGCAALVELKVLNRFGVGYTYIADVRDEPSMSEELTLIRSPTTWRALCAYSGLPPPTNTTGTRLLADHDAQLYHGSEVPIPASTEVRVPFQFFSMQEVIRPRTIVVYMRDSDGTPRCIYQVKVVVACKTRDESDSKQPFHVHREITLAGVPNETFCRWIPVGIADDADDAGPLPLGAKAKRKIQVQNTRKRLKEVRISRPCAVMSFVDWQTSPQGHVLPVETLQLQASFPSHRQDGTSPSVFYVFFYTHSACLVPCQVWRVLLCPCTEISGIKRNMGESSTVHIPLSEGCEESRRAKMKIGLGNGVLARHAGDGDWRIEPKTPFYTMQGFAVRIRPTDDKVRRLRLNAVYDEGSGRTSLRERYVLLFQGVERSGAQPQVPLPVMKLPFKDSKVFRWAISHTNSLTTRHTFTCVHAPHGSFTVSPASITLEPQQSQVITICFKPEMAQLYEFTLWINDESDIAVGYVVLVVAWVYVLSCEYRIARFGVSRFECYQLSIPPLLF